MRATRWKYLPILLIIAGETISFARAVCGKHGSPESRQNSNNGCSYPACGMEFRCVHDKSFCEQSETFFTASQMQYLGRLCTCEDILNYPKLIGTCYTNGVYSPMLTEDDCVNGTSVCSKDASNNFLEGDEAHPFTACNLKCDFEKGQAIEVPKDTYKGCSFPKFDWTVASKSEFSSLQANHYEIIDDFLYVGGTIVPIDVCAMNGIIMPLALCPADSTIQNAPLQFRHLLHGPFSKYDPWSTNGTYLGYIEPGDTRSMHRMTKCTIAIVNKNTGTPMNLMTLHGTGDCHIDSMDTGGIKEGNKGKVIVASGHYAAGGQLKAQTTAAGVGQTILEAHDQADSPFVFLMETEQRIRWLIQPWTKIVNANHKKVSMSGSSADANGDIYIGGYFTESFSANPNYAIISKHSGVDGSIIWEKEFLGVTDGLHLVHDSLDGALYVTFEVPKLTEEPGQLGITCDSTSSDVQVCSVLARLSASNGELQWVRYAYGLAGDKSNYGDVKLAHSDDGPYVYAAFTGVGSFGSSNLKRGTPYSGCMADDGMITTEIDTIFSDLTTPLNPTQCRIHNLGTYFSRTSENAVPVDLDQNLAQCRATDSGQHCLVKYHKLTGRPIWGTVTPLIQDFEPLSNGIIMTGSTSKRTAFDTVEVSGYGSGEEAASMVYQSKIGLDGSGIYVQPIVGHPASVIGGGLTQDPATGDVYIGFSTGSSKTKLGPGLPVGFVQDLALHHQFTQRTTVAKLGEESIPFCIESCGEDGPIISKSMCFIDNVCYHNREGGTHVGISCEICDPTQSQTEWTTNQSGTWFCYIEGVCYTKGEYLKAVTETKQHSESECQLCSPEENTDGWSLKPGFELKSNPIHGLPGECIESTSPKPTPTPTLTPTLLTLTPTLLVTDPPTPDGLFGDDDNDKKADVMEVEKKENVADENFLHGTTVYWIIVAILLVGATVYLNCFRKKIETGEHEFFPVEADII